MLLSLALLLLTGLLLGKICTRLGLPALLGYIAAGIVLGADVLGVLSPAFLDLSPDLRRFALIVILLRAGLALVPGDLRRAGRPAILLCFVPACFEIAGCILLAPPLLGLTYLEAALLGAVIAAVSPAVVVPRMLSLIERGLGTKHAVPHMILTGSSADDVFVLVVFAWLLALLTGGEASAWSFLAVPLSIVLGCAAGIAVGIVLAALLRKAGDIERVLVLLAVCFLLMAAEDSAAFPFSGMLAVMTAGMTIRARQPKCAANLGERLSGIWVFAEILLFGVVGAAVSLAYVRAAGLLAVVLVVLALCFRMLGVLCSTAGAQLTGRERVFTMLAYCPKATVQAAIGGVPLAMGLSAGHTILTAAVVSIVLTAPLGAFFIDIFAPKLLSRT